MDNAKARFKRAFEQFCQKTSLHGWLYLQEGGLFHKLFWALIITSSIVLATYFMIKNTHEFQEATTATDIETTTAPLTDIAFPNIILCNINQLQSSFIKILEGYKEKHDLPSIQPFLHEYYRSS